MINKKQIIAAALAAVTLFTPVGSTMEGVQASNSAGKPTSVKLETAVEGIFNGKVPVDMAVTERYDSGVKNEDGGTTEIVKYNSDNDKYYVVNGTTKQMDIVASEDSQGEGAVVDVASILKEVSPEFGYGDLTSIGINTELNIVAVAVQAEAYNARGKVVIFDYDGKYITSYDAGYQPDMLLFTPDQKTLLVANEGEPRQGYGEGVEDPQGSVTVIDVTSGATNGVTTEITFESYDSKREELISNQVILKKDTAPSVDLEPEYIAVSSDSKYAYIALQENNAIATIDLTKNTVTSIKGLGFKDFRVDGNEIDVQKDDTINIKKEDIFGIYMPDGIVTYEANGKTYILTANEGDAREWGSKETGTYHCNEVEEKRGYDKKVVWFDTSEYEGFADASQNYIFGARSFAIFEAETMELVYDSGSQFEKITAEAIPEHFNASNNKTDRDNRSGKKGPEPEDITVGSIGNNTYAFIGLERIGGIMMYDITDVNEVRFVNYVNSRDFSEPIQGDVSPEGLYFIKGTDRTAKLLVANEVSGTVSTIELQVNEAWKPDAPSEELLAMAETIKGKADGSITGVATTMEYKESSAEVYTSVTGNTITDLAAGVYQIRYKATPSRPASKAAEVTILSGRELVVTFDSNGGSKVEGANPSYNHPVKEPEVPVKAGYRFLGWDVNGEKYDFTRPVTKDITLIACWEKIKQEEVAQPAAVTGIKVTGNTANSISLSWKKPRNATGYEVYAYNTSTKNYVKVATVTGTSVTIKTIAKKGLVEATGYQFFIRSFNKGAETIVYGKDSAVVKATTAIKKPAKVTKVTVASQKTSEVKLTWAKATNATEYKVYGYNKTTKKYVLVGTTTKTSMTVKKLGGKKLTAGTTYKFYVTAVRKKNGATASALKSPVISTATAPAKVVLTAKASAKKANLSWKKVTGASGYEVSMYQSSSKKYVKIKTITKGTTVNYSKAKLSSGKTYKFKVRAYKTVAGKKVYGSYSSVTALKVK